jgi:hypothetical protein
MKGSSTLVETENLLIKEVEQSLNNPDKKYNVHGKVEKNNETGKAEISYYECDKSVCNKVTIKRSKGEELREY